MKQSDSSGEVRKGNQTNRAASTGQVPNGGYGWVVVFASMMCNMIADGILYAYSVLKIPLNDHYNVGEGLILLPGSVAVGVYMFCGPIYSRLCSKYGCRATVMVGALVTCLAMVISITSASVYTLVVVYGVCAGFGLGLIYLPSIVVLSYYFDKRITLATGVVVSGTGIGVLSFGQLTGILCDHYGWKGGMVILSGIALNCAVFGALMKLPPGVKSNALDGADSHSNENYTPVATEDGEVQFKHKKSKRNCLKMTNSFVRMDLLCDPTVAVLSIAQMFGFFGYLLVMLLLVTVAEKQLRATPFQARLTMTALGIVNTLARFFFGWLPGPKTCTIGTINWLTLLITSIACFLFPLFKTYWHLMVFSVVFGISTAPYVGLTPAVIYDAVGKQFYNDALGMAFLFRGLSSILGPTLGGYLADATGSFSVPFMVAASALALSTALHFIARWTYRFHCGPCRSRVKG